MSQEDSMTILNSKISNIFAINKFDEYYLPSVNKHTFEKIDSVTVFNKKFQYESSGAKRSTLSQEDTLHIIVGMDSGLLANYVLESPLASSSKYLFVELPEVLSLLNIDIPDTLKNSFFICSAEQFPQRLKEMPFNLFIVKHNFKLHYSMAATGNSHDDYALLSHDVEKTIEHEYFESSIGFTQKNFFQQQLDNIAENLQPASLLRDNFKGKTCIILGGGPSLDEHLDWIRNNRDKLVVFSVSRIAGKLAKLGIKSNIIMTVDPQDHSFEVNESMMALSQDNLLVCAYHTCSDIVAQWNGNLLFTGIKTPWQDASTDTNIQTLGPTVTNSAAHLAAEMGFSQILLCGVDYCNSQTGVTHTTDTYKASFGPNIGTMYEWVETYAGDMAETLLPLVHAIDSLSQATQDWPEISYINLSHHAAKVKGVEYKSTSEISLSAPTAEQFALLSPGRFQLTNDEKMALLSQLDDEFITALQDIDKMLQKLQRAQNLCQQIANVGNTTQLIVPLSQQLEAIESELNSEYKNLCYLIKFYGFYEFSHFLSTKDVDAWTQEDVNSQNQTYYRAFYDIAKEIQQLALNAQKRLRSRIAEHASQVDLSAFVPQWQADKHFGRVHIWLREHPHAAKNLSEDDWKLIDALKADYQNLFNKKVYEGKVDSPVTNLENAFKKLSILMQHKHLLGIRKMVQYTSPFLAQDPQIAHLYYLAKSYQLYLENSLEQALDTLLLLDPSLREEAEIRHLVLLSLKLDKLDLAEESLAKLVQFSDEYIPQYAHILSLQGNAQSALTHYLDYLDKYPEDIAILLKLGLFLASVGEISSAKAAFEQVLSLEEDNQAAQSYLQQLN
jgi:hypothetical protein